MTQFKISEAARLLGVSDDTVRRWADSGRLSVSTGDGVARVDGRELARVAQEMAPEPDDATARSSARNQLTGLVTKVTTDTVMAQVEMQCGPYRIVSLMSAEAARDLALEPGSRAVASVKATTVVVTVP